MYKIDSKVVDTIVDDEFMVFEQACRRFQKQFRDSILNNEFECELIRDDNLFPFTFKIYDKLSNKLVSLVHLDDAISMDDPSLEEFNMSNVPDNVKIVGINMNNFIHEFEEFVRVIKLDYDEYLEDLFMQYRSMDFPFHQYTHYEMIADFRKLCLFDTLDFGVGTMAQFGMKLIRHFHRSIYQTSVDGRPTVYDAWFDDKLMKKCIRNRTLYQSKLNPNKILQGFNISKIAPKPSVLSPARAKVIIDRYASDSDCIYDPYPGFSGKMLATISLGKQYVCNDTNVRTYKERALMWHLLSISRNNYPPIIDPILSNDINHKFSYNDTTAIVYVNHFHSDPNPADTADDVITKCIIDTECSRYIFIVRDTKLYKAFIIDEIGNKTHFYKNKEFVVCINREDLMLGNS